MPEFTILDVLAIGAAMVVVLDAIRRLPEWKPVPIWVGPALLLVGVYTLFTFILDTTLTRGPTLPAAFAVASFWVLGLEEYRKGRPVRLHGRDLTSQHCWWRVCVRTEHGTFRGRFRPSATPGRVGYVDMWNGVARSIHPDDQVLVKP